MISIARLNLKVLIFRFNKMKNHYSEEASPHQPVLYQQIIDYLQPRSPGKYVDGTIGAGGHTAAILAASAPKGCLLGLDVDQSALEIVRSRITQDASRLILKHGSYSHLCQYLQEIGWECVNGILLDLGVSSMQLDHLERGFSFNKAAPLDMRFDQSKGITASQLLDKFDHHQIFKILREYGEEPRAESIAASIIKNRPIRTTAELANLVLNVYGHKHNRIHPATRTFQAIRIATNSELDNLTEGLEQSISALCPGGRLAVISFHSLEDRTAKQYFHLESRDCICPPQQIKCTCNHKPKLKVITKKVITPSKEEIAQNPRARSAKMRVVEKL